MKEFEQLENGRLKIEEEEQKKYLQDKDKIEKVKKAFNEYKQNESFRKVKKAFDEE